MLGRAGRARGLQGSRSLFVGRENVTASRVRTPAVSPGCSREGRAEGAVRGAPGEPDGDTCNLSVQNLR